MKYRTGQVVLCGLLLLSIVVMPWSTIIDRVIGGFLTTDMYTHKVVYSLNTIEGSWSESYSFSELMIRFSGKKVSSDNMEQFVRAFVLNYGTNVLYLSILPAILALAGLILGFTKPYEKRKTRKILIGLGILGVLTSLYYLYGVYNTLKIMGYDYPVFAVITGVPLGKIGFMEGVYTLKMSYGWFITLISSASLIVYGNSLKVGYVYKTW